MVRTALAVAGVLAVVAPATAAGAPRVQVMIHGPSALLLAPRTVDARSVLVRASGKRCRVAAGTGLAALAGARRADGPAFRVRDDGGSCNRSSRNSGALFVTQVGPNRNRGRDGWVYKVGTRGATAGAADPTGAFGSGRMRGGERVTWFWCRMSRRGSCQRTLTVTPSRWSVGRSGRVRVTVRGHDDAGRARRVGGARVLLGDRTATTNRRGVAVLRAPRRTGWVRLTATRGDMVRAFDRRVRVR